jgi:hypothetical protein
MTTTAINTPGTKLYFLDVTVSPHIVVAVTALKGFSPAGGGKRKKNDKSNFDSSAYNENQGGRIDPPEASGQIILLKTDSSHQKLKALMEGQANGTYSNDTQWFLADSDATSPPTIVASVLTPPQTASPKHWARSGIKLVGYIATLQPKYEDDNIIMADFAIQVSGAPTWYAKGDLIAKTY